MSMPAAPSAAVAAVAARPKHHTLPGTLVLLFLAGLAMFDRGIAVMSIPGVPLYLSEVVLGLGVVYLLTRPRPLEGITSGRWFAPLLLVMFLGWGLVKLLVSLGNPIMEVVRDSATVYYAVFGLVVAGLSSYDSRFNPRELLRVYGRFVPWLLVVAPLRIIGSSGTQFAETGPAIPGSDIPLLASHRLGNLGVSLGIAVVYLATSGRRDRATIAGVVAGMLMIIIVGTQNRGGLLAGAFIIGVALLVWNRHVKLRLAWVVAIILAVGVFAWGLDLRIDTGQREISVQQLTSNLDSVLGDDSDTGTANQLSDTVDFRQELWDRVLHETVVTGQLENGWGFGMNLGAEFLPTHEDRDLRNPHNSHLTVLVRLGLVGVAIWVTLWLSWFYGVVARARAAVRARRPEHDAPGRLAMLVAAGAAGILANAFVDPTLETPMVAVWLWSLFGFGLIAVTSTGARQPAPDALRAGTT